MTLYNIPSYVKDPQAVIAFKWDWSAWLGQNETIANLTVTPDAGISVGNTSASNGAVTAWISGGLVGTDYAIACEILTSTGRTDVRRIQMQVRLR